jgi:hypothetical protein
MRIDRGTFLALCGAIACKVEQQPTVVPTVAISSAATSMEAPPGASADPPAACDDYATGGLAPTCEGMQDPDRSCAPFDFPRDQCDAFVQFLKPRLAAQYTACMRALSSSDLCDAMKSYACKENALRGACPDANLVAYCAAEGQPTQGDDEGCMLWARGLNDVGRQTAMRSCGFTWSCMEGLSSPSVE